MNPLSALLLALHAARRYQEAYDRRCLPCMHLWWTIAQDMADATIQGCVKGP